MDRIGRYIIENIFVKPTEYIHHSVMQNGVEIGMELDEMCSELFNVLEFSNLVDVKIYGDNIWKQRKTVISFFYEGRLCEIGEHYGSQRDYFYVRISPV
jgi:hypothetical protein